MKLAAITGVNGVYTDEDIARIRSLAVQRRAATHRRPRKAARKRSAAVMTPVG